jgi:hypothetical protein
MQVVRLLTVVLTAACALPAAAQQHGSAHTGHRPAASPYAGLEARPIKALSDEQVADLKAGRGMGLALAAELNGYPGPTHVIEHAAALDLSDAQEARLRELVAEMKAAAIPVGEAIIAAEMELDRSFGSGSITPGSLQQLTARIGDLQGALRAAHLKYHLDTVEVLSPGQIARYNALRGYNEAADAPSHP